MLIKPAARLCSWPLLIAGSLVLQFAATPKSAEAGQSTVDVVSLKSGRSLRGGIAWQEPNGTIVMAVSLEWYRESNAAKVAAVLTEAIELRRLAWTQTRCRIAEQIKLAADSSRLAFFLKTELDRVDQLLAEPKPPDPDFLWVDVPQNSIARVTKASSEQHRLALFAWSERLAHVENRDVLSLKKELTNRGVNLNLPPPELSDRLPARLQNEGEWAARFALVEYVMTTPFDFQGMGDALTRTDAGQAINLAEVVPKVFQAQFGSFLRDFGNDGQSITKPPIDDEWLTPAIRQTELAKKRGFRVTRLEVDAVSLRVTVESRFVAAIAPGRWRTVWRTTVVEDGAKLRPEAEARIENDPQLKSVNELAKTFGLVDTSVIQRAIRFGAATMAAQQNADSLFSEFCDRYTRRLDAPPLPIPMGP